MQLVQHVASTDPVLPVFLIRRPSGPIGCSREHVMKRFTKARDERGKATAVKSFRILSALFNFALADQHFY